MRFRKVVIIDIDDCMMPWGEKVHAACIEAGLAKPDSTWTQWSMWEDYGCPKEDWLEVVNMLVVPGGIYHAPPYDGAVDALRELQLRGGEVHLVTARGFHDHAEEIRQWTQEWVETFDVPGALQFAHDKGEVAQKLGATHAIDDGIHNVIAMQNEGVDVYLMNQPHNASVVFDPYRRVSSIPEFVKKVLANG